MLEVFDSHFQQVLNAVLVGAFQRLYRAKERENFFNGEQGGIVIGLRCRHGMKSILAEHH